MSAFDAQTQAFLQTLGAPLDVAEDAFADEIAGDLAKIWAEYPNGATIEELADYYGEPTPKVMAAVTQLMMADRVRLEGGRLMRAEEITPPPMPRMGGSAQESQKEITPREGRHAPTKLIGVGVQPHRHAAKDASLARHAAPKAEPDRVWALADDHPAIVEGRTLFPSTVVGTFDSARFLVSGKNNPKLGAEMRKGPWSGMPIYHVTLEERATCPRSCLQWASCYGNGMHLARRNDHRDPDFLYALKAEVITAARQHPNGFVVRLHTLGDFFSVEYVQLWADLLDMLPELRVFGYTARREDDADEESRTIAKAVRWLTDEAFDIFAIRFSGYDGPQGTIVTRERDDRSHVIMCPAQDHHTAACATCGLCSSAEARDKTIGFLMHGPKRKSKIKAIGDDSGEDGRMRISREVKLDWRRRYEDADNPMPASALAKEYGCSPLSVRKGIISVGGTIRTKAEASQLRSVQRLTLDKTR